MSRQTINILNKILQGQEMAYNLYEMFLDKIKNKYLYDQLLSIQMVHLRHKQILIDRISLLGGKPEPQSFSVFGKMKEWMSLMNTTVYADYGDILKDLYNGELMGIDKTQQLIYNRLPKEELQLMQKILADVVDNAHKLKELLREVEKQKVH